MTDDAALLEEMAEEMRATGSDQVTTLDENIRKAIELQDLIDGIKAALAAHEETQQRLLQHEIPDGMAALGILEKTVDGATVKCRDFINGKLPKEEAPRQRAFDWLRQNGADPLVKAYFDFEIPKGKRQEKKIDAAITRITDILAKLDLDIREETNIHPQTLYAFIREKMRKAEKVPLEMLGLYVGRVAKISMADADTAHDFTPYAHNMEKLGDDPRPD